MYIAIVATAAPSEWPVSRMVPWSVPAGAARAKQRRPLIDRVWFNKSSSFDARGSLECSHCQSRLASAEQQRVPLCTGVDREVIGSSVHNSLCNQDAQALPQHRTTPARSHRKLGNLHIPARSRGCWFVQTISSARLMALLLHGELVAPKEGIVQGVRERPRAWCGWCTNSLIHLPQILVRMACFVLENVKSTTTWQPWHARLCFVDG